MNLDKIFKVAVLALFAVAILVYGMVNRYQFFHASGSLSGFACNQYTGKCEWLSPEEMGKDKLVKYQEEKQREEMGRQLAPQAPPAPDKPRQ
jgi:hypothetical protein